MTNSTSTKSAKAEASTSRKVYVEVIRHFSGLAGGQVIDATEWRHLNSLVESRYVRLADKDLVAASVPCTKCRKRWVDQVAFDTHDCADDTDD